jgi:hypothetical protein
MKEFYVSQFHFFGGNSKFASEGLNKFRIYNGEDIDIFSNPDYVIPSITFQDDNIQNITKVSGFALRSNGYLYALGQDSTPKAVIYYKETPSGTNPTSWTEVLVSNNAPAIQGYSPLTIFTSTESGTAKTYLYYHTSTNKLSRYGNFEGTPTETASFGTLSGLTTNDRLSHIVYNGELFIANGNYVARVSSQGNFVDKSFTLPSGLRAIDMIPMVLTSGGDYMAVLCQDTNNPTQSQVVIWDMVSTAGAMAKIAVPLAKPQWIHKLGNTFFVGGVNPNNQFEIYIMQGLIVAVTPLFVIQGVNYTLTRPVSPVTTKYSVTNTLLFGLEGSKSGMYAIGAPMEDQFSLVLAKRFDTTYYANHQPYGYTAINDAEYVSFYDANNSAYKVKIANGQIPVRSSKAIIETLLYDANYPYLDKTWQILEVGLQPLTNLTSLTFEARENTVDTYKPICSNNVISLANTENQTFVLEGFSGKVIQLKISFTSSGNSCPKLKWIALKGNYNETF